MTNSITLDCFIRELWHSLELAQCQVLLLERTSK